MRTVNQRAFLARHPVPFAMKSFGRSVNFVKEDGESLENSPGHEFSLYLGHMDLVRPSRPFVAYLDGQGPVPRHLAMEEGPSVVRRW